MSENRVCLGTSRTTVSNSIQAAPSCNRQMAFFPRKSRSASSPHGRRRELRLYLPDVSRQCSASDGRPSGQYTTFATARSGPTDLRASGVAVAPDGSLYISADAHGKIWKMSKAR